MKVVSPTLTVPVTVTTTSEPGSAFPLKTGVPSVKPLLVTSSKPTLRGSIELSTVALAVSVVLFPTESVETTVAVKVSLSVIVKPSPLITLTLHSPLSESAVVVKVVVPLSVPVTVTTTSEPGSAFPLKAGVPSVKPLLVTSSKPTLSSPIELSTVALAVSVVLFPTESAKQLSPSKCHCP